MVIEVIAVVDCLLVTFCQGQVRRVHWFVAGKEQLREDCH